MGMLNMALILKLLGISCTHIKITQLRPFSSTSHDSGEVNIGSLYY